MKPHKLKKTTATTTDYIHTAAAHRQLRRSFRQFATNSADEIVEACLLGSPLKRACTYAPEALSPHADHIRILQMTLSCEVVLMTLLCRGCVYPELWRDNLANMLETFSGSDEPQERNQVDGLRRVLNNDDQTSPPWLDQPWQKLKANRDWQACIEMLALHHSLDLEGMLLSGSAEVVRYRAGRSLFRQPIIQQINRTTDWTPIIEEVVAVFSSHQHHQTRRYPMYLHLEESSAEDEPDDT